MSKQPVVTWTNLNIRTTFKQFHPENMCV